MKITIDRINQSVNLLAKNDEGNEVLMDGSESIGGEGKGARPMQVVLMALGGCSSMDVLSILKKMKQDIKSYSVDVEGQRDKDAVPAVFTDIHVTYNIEGENLNESKVLHAAELSMDKYCSVTKMLESTTGITYSININGKKVK